MFKKIVLLNCAMALVLTNSMQARTVSQHLAHYVAYAPKAVGAVALPFGVISAGSLAGTALANFKKNEKNVSPLLGPQKTIACLFVGVVCLTVATALDDYAKEDGK